MRRRAGAPAGLPGPGPAPATGPAKVRVECGGGPRPAGGRAAVRDTVPAHRRRHAPPLERLAAHAGRGAQPPPPPAEPEPRASERLGAAQGVGERGGGCAAGWPVVALAPARRGRRRHPRPVRPEACRADRGEADDLHPRCRSRARLLVARGGRAHRAGPWPPRKPVALHRRPAARPVRLVGPQPLGAAQGGGQVCCLATGAGEADPRAASGAGGTGGWLGSHPHRPPAPRPLRSGGTHRRRSSRRQLAASGHGVAGGAAGRKVRQRHDVKQRSGEREVAEPPKH
mmetsp:Transcript_24183/g.71204  ORF Transcript_24183/g.71204 Transcript_24183/m.71204 type:complete len:285 (-) Transcript_24183:301-1155(-)